MAYADVRAYPLDIGGRRSSHGLPSFRSPSSSACSVRWRRASLATSGSAACRSSTNRRLLRELRDASRDGWFVAVRAADDERLLGARAPRIARADERRGVRRMSARARPCSGSCVLCSAGCDDMGTQPKQMTYSPLVGPAAMPAGTVEYGSEAAKRRPSRSRSRARAGALPDLLHSLSFGARRRPRHGRPARLSGAALVSYRSAARGAAAAFLRCDHTRVWRHVPLCGSGRSPRSLGHRGLYSRAGAQPKRSTCGSFRRARGPAMSRARRARRVAHRRRGVRGIRARLDLEAGGISPCLARGTDLLDRVAARQSRAHLHSCTHRRSMGLCDPRRSSRRAWRPCRCCCRR